MIVTFFLCRSNCFLHRSAVPCGLPAQSSQSKAPGFMMSKSALLKVILLGDGGVGKSSLMNRYVTNKFDSHLFHTIGVEFLNKELEVDGRRVTLQIWDTAGQERFRSLRTPFYRGSDCCLLTFSLDDGQSFQNLANWKKEFTYYADIKDPDSFPFVVLGNKLDIPERQVSGEDARKWCRENGGHPYFETSAKDATNVASAFEEAVRRIQMTDDRDGHLISTDTNTVDLQRKSQAQNSCCWAQPSVCDRKWASRRSCDTPAEGTQGVCFLQKMGTGGGSAAPQHSLWRPRLESWCKSAVLCSYSWFLHVMMSVTFSPSQKQIESLTFLIWMFRFINCE